MITEEFNSAYKKLNPEQKKAVDTVEGPVIVIAGPGTGKTQILGLRIANILIKTDTSPENILALTFTNAGVVAIRKRLFEIIGVTAYRVNIFTFHSFCEDIIRSNPDDFQGILSSQIASDVEQLEIVEEIIKEGEYKILKPWGDKNYYVGKIISAISELKKDNKDINGFAIDIKKQEEELYNIEDLYHNKGAHKGKMKGKYKKEEKDIERKKELLRAYEAYKDKLREKKLYDYDDVVLETISVMQSNKDLLLILQEQYQYILVDEHQDTNDSQNILLELLTSFFERPNLFIVGDEKQAIYRFQGASLRNFYHFKDNLKDIVSIKLKNNYRSAQDVLDMAHSLIQEDKLTSKTNTKGRIRVLQLADAEQEVSFIAEDIKERIKQGVEPSEIAVFYRENKEILDIVDVFEKTGIPFVIESKQDILSDPDIKRILLLIEAISDFGNDEKLFKALHIDFLNIDAFEIYKIVEKSRKEKKSMYECLDAELYSKLEGWKKSAQNSSVASFFEKIVKESGYLKYALYSKDRMSKLNRLFDEIKTFQGDLVEFLAHLEVLKKYNLQIKNTQCKNDGVKLMTAHGSKGLEFTEVYIKGVKDKKWGNKTQRSSFKLKEKIQDNEDERRLFFVALTRAKKRLTITYHEEPSQFLAELDQSLLEKKNIETVRSFRFGDKKTTIKTIDKKYLNSLFLEKGLNATALNNYLDCPWKYYFRNLIMIPSVMNKSLVYGNVIHKTLENFFEKIKKEEKVNKDWLLENFSTNLSNSLIGKNDHREASEKGLNSLSGYFDEYNKSWKSSILNEFKVKGVLLDNILLSGKLDKIEINGDCVNVVDYKTGKIRTRNDIEGKTKTSKGNYKRQLVFYKVLLNRFDDGRYSMETGDIDFIDPDEKGKYHKERFLIEKDEVAELEKTIKNVAEEILALSFWNKKCDDKKCEYCELRKMIGE